MAQMAAVLGDPILDSKDVYYFPDVTRDTSAAKVAQVGRPIFRDSSIPSMYALTFYDNAGKLVHAFVHPELRPVTVIVDSAGNILGVTAKDAIERIKSINPAKYEVLSEDPVAFGGGKQRRKSTRKARRTRRTRRTSRN